MCCSCLCSNKQQFSPAIFWNGHFSDLTSRLGLQITEGWKWLKVINLTEVSFLNGVNQKGYSSHKPIFEFSQWNVIIVTNLFQIALKCSSGCLFGGIFLWFFLSYSTLQKAYFVHAYIPEATDSEIRYNGLKYTNFQCTDGNLQQRKTRPQF